MIGQLDRQYVQPFLTTNSYIVLCTLYFVLCMDVDLYKLHIYMYNVYTHSIHKRHSNDPGGGDDESSEWTHVAGFRVQSGREASWVIAVPTP